jgi:hypothetical protein
MIVPITTSELNCDRSGEKQQLGKLSNCRTCRSSKVVFAILHQPQSTHDMLLYWFDLAIFSTSENFMAILESKLFMEFQFMLT